MLMKKLGGLVVPVMVSLCLGASPQDSFNRSTASAYRYACPVGDLSCQAWTQFRSNHPFPYQSIEGKPLAGGTLAIFISEPPPVMSKGRLDGLIRAAFGKDLVALNRFRWRLGVDGWLEDVVLTVRSTPSAGNPLSDPVLRDRIAFLYLALFGTTFGGGFDMDADSHFNLKEIGAPNLQVSTREVRQWMDGAANSWERLDGNTGGTTAWPAIAKSHAMGAYVAGDRTLVLLTFPSSLLLRAQENPTVLEPLRLPFRCFAVASDALVGALVSPGGQVAIVGRPRTNDLSKVPPLRFETFQLVASQSSDALSQSYERTALFAGRLSAGEYRGKDWAPIYLSDPLIDSEFGALLNTTDQMLKSWSEAGSTEYLYFNYPKPATFPFGAMPLSSVIEKETGSTQVLFNWNTSGSAVVVEGTSGKVLTSRQTGALPVTYGSDMDGSGNTATGTLLTEEERAYKYFAKLRDSNLERVVQYTLLYQFCRSITQGQGQNTLAKNLSLASSEGVLANREAARVRSESTYELLNKIQAGNLRLKPQTNQQFTALLEAVRQAYPDLSRRQLANVLADRFSADATRIEQARAAKFESQQAQLQKQTDQFDADVRRFNAMAANRSVSDLTVALKRAELNQRRKELEAAYKELETAGRRQNPLASLSKLLWRIALVYGDLENVRAEFVQKHVYEPAGCIKTPSIVVSWDRNDIEAIGGHNLDARALELKPNASVSGFALKESEKGYVLEYNPAKASQVEAHAAELARAVEHQRIRDVDELARIASTAPPPVRTRFAALELPNSSAGRATWVGQIGKRTYASKLEFVDDLRSIAAKNDCCIFIAHDQEEVAFATEQNLKPPPAVVVYEIRDTPSLGDYLQSVSGRRGAGERPVIFFDTPESHVRALGIGLESNRETQLTGMAELLGERTSGVPERRLDGLAQRDLNGRESWLRSIGRVTESRVKALFGRITVNETAATWRGVEVQTMETREVGRFVEGIGWDASRDGRPAAVSLKFRGTSTRDPAIDVSVIAGFDDHEYAAGSARLVASHERNLSAAAAKQASIAQYAMTVRNELRQMSDIKVRRFSVIVQNGETRTLMSWNGHQLAEGTLVR